MQNAGDHPAASSSIPKKAGVPGSVAMKLTGPFTEAVYRRYAIADHAALSEGVEKLAKLHAAPQEAAKIVSMNR